MKSAAAAAQVRVTARLDQVRRANEAAQGVPAPQRGRGLGAEVALARHDSPHRGARHLGLAKALVHEMPFTLAALERGEISEWRATLLVRETACLSREHREEVDRRLAGELASLGDRRTAARARAIGYELDPGSALRRTRGASCDRRVSLRPAPDTMSLLTGFLPVAQGVACHVALRRHADSLRSEGDQRTRGQIMADTLVERLTGQATAAGTNIEVELVMTDTAAFGGDDTPAHVVGYGPVPAGLARDLLLDAEQAWLRRLYASLTTGELVTMDSRRRPFAGQLRHTVVLRDDLCRTPWCDAPIRHVDHPERAADGGPTTLVNSAGLCETCNYTKELAGWTASPDSGAGPLGATQRHSITLTTPTGHQHRSRAPAILSGLARGTPRLTFGWVHQESALEQHLRELMSAA